MGFLTLPVLPCPACGGAAVAAAPLTARQGNTVVTQPQTPKTLVI